MLEINDIASKTIQPSELQEEIIHAYPSKDMLSVTGNVTNEDDVRRMIEGAVGVLNGLDVVRSP